MPITLKEAIKELNLYLDDDVWSDWGKFRRSMRLGIEALKYRRQEKDAGHLDSDDLLPGETED